MKKLVLLLFTTIFLSSCNIQMGDIEKHWIIYEVQNNGVRNSKNAIYTVKSFNDAGYCHNGFRFEDQYGKFQVGDTVELIKLKY